MKTFLRKNILPVVIISFAAGIVLSILAPYGTGRMDTVTRFAYWIGLCMAGGFGSTLFDVAAYLKKTKQNIWLRALGRSIGSAALVSTFVLVMQSPNNTLAGLALTIFYVWIIAILICGTGALIELAFRKPVATAPSRASLIDRLKPALRSAEIYALSSEDHYVRIITSKGDDLVLIRLKDAIAETAPLRGVQTHRSWWVAETGIDKSSFKNGKSEIVLKNGNTVPVSRSGKSRVKDAGWI